MNSACRFLAATALVVTAVAACAQQPGPRIGYVYPAGGRQGSTFQIAVGGQYLDGVTNVFVSGAGVQAKVVDFNKPMPQGLFNQLRDKLRELQAKKQAATRAGRRGAARASTNTWTTADEKLMAEIRAKMLKNPPNRNATPAIAEVATVSVVITPMAEPGEREIRLGTPNGLSNPLRFSVGQLPEFSEPPARAPNPDLDRFRERFGRQTTPEPPKEGVRISLPATVNGQITPGGVDRYRFFARRGQRLVVSVRARDLIPYLPDAVPGWFQAALALYDAKGRELAYDDDFRFHPDPVLYYEIKSDGEYIIEIKDAIYRGREDFVYRMTVGELPFVTSVFPLGGRAGEQTTVELKGWNLPVTSLTVSAPGPGLVPVAVRQGDLISNPVPFAADTLPETLEQEPNNAPGTAQKLALPVIVNGRIDSPGDVDVFRLEGPPGQEIVAEVRARRLNSPLDSLLRLTDTSGRQLAVNDDHEDKGSGLNTHHADSFLRLRLPADGRADLHLGDTQHKGGPEYAYRLRVSAPQPDFDLRVVPSSLSVRAGATVPLTVFALRKDGFDGEIALGLKEAPSGFTFSGARVPAGQDHVRLTLTAPVGASKDVLSLKLEGRATIQGREVVRPAVPAEDMMQAFAYRHLVPAQELKVAVSDRGAQRNVVRILSPTPVRIPTGGTARVKVGVPTAIAAGRLHLELSEPPEGLSIQNVASSGWASEIVLQADDAKAKPGLAGNLIVNAYMSRDTAGPDKARANRRRVPVGTLPAIPFEIVAR